MQSSPTLTLYRPDDDTILGELSDAALTEEHTGSGTNFVFSGFAGDGTIEDLLVFLDSGFDTVRFEYLDEKERSTGTALVLKPAETHGAGGTMVRIETADEPLKTAIV